MSIQALLPDWQVPARVKAFFYTRQGGQSQSPYTSFNLAQHVGDDAGDVAANRALLDTLLPGKPGLQWLQQVHGQQVHRLQQVQSTLIGDGLVSSEPGMACCILTADCLPVFIASTDGAEVGLAHAGWRGLAAGILPQLLRQMRTPASELQVWFGPAIGPCHFEVGDDMRRQFVSKATDSDVETCFQPIPGTDKYLANLYQLAQRQLQQLGITAVSGGEYCTVCDSENFYSYRRDGDTGRNLSIIYLADS